MRPGEAYDGSGRVELPESEFRFHFQTARNLVCPFLNHYPDVGLLAN
jgi:hypothetical protein